MQCGLLVYSDSGCQHRLPLLASLLAAAAAARMPPLPAERFVLPVDPPETLQHSALQVEHELEMLAWPGRDWVAPRKASDAASGAAPMLDVLIVGAGEYNWTGLGAALRRCCKMVLVRWC